MLILKERLTFIVIWNNIIYKCVCVCVHVCMHACVCVCVYFISHYIYYFLVSLIGYFCLYQKSNDFCLLKIWIYELLLVNIKQRSVQQSTISADELPYEFLRTLSIFRRKFYCLCPATVAVDINVETLKENGILLSQVAQNVVDAHYLRNITDWDYLLGNFF